MHFTQLNDGTGGKAGKFAVVAGLHVLVAMGLSWSRFPPAMSRGIAEAGPAPCSGCPTNPGTWMTVSSDVLRFY